MTNSNGEATQARAARIAGAMFLIPMATSIFGQSVVRDSLVVSGDATQTAQNIIEHERFFRIGILADVVTFTGVIVLVWALYVLLRRVDRNLALLAVMLRVVEVAVHYVAVLFSLIALMLLGDADYLTTFDESQRHSLARLAIRAQGAGVNLGFVLTGVGSSVFAYVLLRSGYVPKMLAAWGVFSSLLLATYPISVIVFPAVAPYWLFMMVPMFFYEVPLGVWLLVKGAKVNSSAASAPEQS